MASTISLSITLDMTTALRLSRFEVETGVGLDQLLVQAVEAWEKADSGEPRVAKDTRVPTYFDYTPRARPSKTWRACGLYDREVTSHNVV